MRTTLEQAGSRRPGARRGFSLVEVLMAVMILGIGLIMVAGIFPVGATWTRQTAEETMAGMIARNAVGIVQMRYSSGDLGGVPATVTDVPALPLVERAYAFGTSQPYPANNPATSGYFWTALARREPGAANRFTLYILVFRKGDQDQQFPLPNGATRLGTSGARGSEGDAVPVVCSGAVADQAFPVGSQGIGLTSGTVFRKINTTGGTNIPLAGTEAVAYVPPALGTTVSPLVFVYQTTVGF